MTTTTVEAASTSTFRRSKAARTDHYDHEGCCCDKEEEDTDGSQHDSKKRPKLDHEVTPLQQLTDHRTDDDDDEVVVSPPRGGMEESDDVGCTSSRSHGTSMEEIANNNNDDDASTTESKIAFVSDPNDLEEYIFRDEVQLAVWRRSSKLPDFIPALSDPALDPSCLPTFLGKVTPSTVVDLMSKKLLPTTTGGKEDDDNTSSRCCLSKHLINDIERLVTVFAQIIDNDEVHVKLEATNDNGCCFWHQDTVPLRLVTTYKGPCTEYVHPNVSQQILQQRQYNAPKGLTQSLTNLDVALFKGREFDTSGGLEEEDDEEADEDTDIVVRVGSGIVHRSPRIEGTGIVRLVLVLDIPSEFHEEEEEEEEDMEDSGDEGEKEEEEQER